MDKNGYNESLLTGWNKECFITGITCDNLVRHEIFYGTANRPLSKKYGLWIYLTPELHTTTKNGIHSNKELDLLCKKAGQNAFEENHTREEFLKIFGRNYLWELIDKLKQ